MDDTQLYNACRMDGTPEQEDAFKILWAYLYPIAYSKLSQEPDPAQVCADCTQKALIKIHRSLHQCREPATFLFWAAQIVNNNALDILRDPKRRRTMRLPDDPELLHPLDGHVPAPEIRPNLRAVLEAELKRAVGEQWLSERSYRVVIGRFLKEQRDELLAAEESELSGDTVLPSHIQVTRSKNLDNLRNNQGLKARLRDLLDD